METYWNPATRKNGLSDKNGRGVYAREHKPLLDKEIAKVREKYGNKLAEVTFDETAPRQLRNRIVTAPVQIIEHDRGSWWERTITARITDGSLIPVILDHVYWNWPADSPAHIGLNGIKTIHLINQQQKKETEWNTHIR